MTKSLSSLEHFYILNKLLQSRHIHFKYKFNVESKIYYEMFSFFFSVCFLFFNFSIKLLTICTKKCRIIHKTNYDVTNSTTGDDIFRQYHRQTVNFASFYLWGFNFSVLTSFFYFVVCLCPYIILFFFSAVCSLLHSPRVPMFLFVINRLRISLAEE